MSARPPVRATLIAALVLLLPAAAAPIAQAGWTAPQTLLRPGFNVKAAGNERGDEAFVWEVTTSRFQRNLRGHSGQVSYVRARLRLPDGRLTRPQTVSRSDQIVAGATVGLDARGTATAVWTQAVRGRDFTIMVAVRPPGGRFGAPVALGRTGKFLGARPALAVAPDGAAVVLWRRADRLQAASRPPGRCRAGRPRGCFRPVQDLPAGFHHTVVFGPRDTAYAAWAGLTPAGIQLAVARRGRRFGSPRLVSPRGVPASEPTIAVAQDGSAVVAWRRSEAPPGPIDAAVRDPDGLVSEPQTVSPAVADPPNVPPRAGAEQPQVRLNRQGEAILVWQQFRYTRERPDLQEIAAAVRPAGGTFGPAATISPSGVDAGGASLAVDRRGNTVVAWNSLGAGVLASVRTPGGSFGPPATVAAGRAAPVTVTVAAGDRVTAAWFTVAATQLSDWTP